jgi:MFS family permease
MAPVTKQTARDGTRLRAGGQRAGGGRDWLRAATAVAAVGWGANQFAPLLLLYRAELNLSATTVNAAFGLYALGLIPGLLVGGPISDRFGRRRIMVPALFVSLLASALLVAGGDAGLGWLFAGRLVAGIASGAAFSSGAAWIKELSATGATGGANHGPRRVTVSMSAGFAGGPLVAGVLAQWAPLPTVLPYLPHLLLTTLALSLAMRTRETRTPGRAAGLWQALRVPGVRARRFTTVVLPLAPWVFGSASIALAYLPGLVRDRLGGHALVFGAVVTTLSAVAGILVQPLARRMDDPHRPRRLIGTALTIVVAGLLVAAVAAASTQPAVVVVAVLVLGAGYGCCQVCGLQEVQRLARPDNLAGLTAIYQATSYLGFAAPFLLAALEPIASPGVLLVVVAALAALTLAWTTRRAGPAEDAEPTPSLRTDRELA